MNDRRPDLDWLRIIALGLLILYLIHQTIIVVTAHHLDALQLPIPIEITLLLGATVLGCWFFFDLGRRIPALRPWIGLSSDAAVPIQTTPRGKDVHP